MIITKDIYLSAKRIVEFYENNQSNKQRNIAVIAFNIDDFLMWKKENNLTGERIDGSSSAFRNGSSNYFRVSKICDLCSIGIHEIIETENSKLIDNYDHIIHAAEGALYSD